MFAHVCTQTQQFEVTPIQRALDGLRQRKRLSLGDCLSQLCRLRVRIQAARILQAFAPQRYRELWAEQGAKMFFEYLPSETSVLEMAAIETAQTLVPVIADYILDERMINLENGDLLDLDIVPMGIGGVMDDDLDFSQYAESMGLLMFIKYLDTGLDDLEYWEQAGDHFGWPDGLVPDYVLYESQVKFFDTDVLKERMRKRGVLGFWVVVEIALQQTGNLLFDYDPINEWGVLPSFSLEGLAELVEAWKEAQPIERKYKKALARLEKNSDDIYRRLLRCWNESAVYSGYAPRGRFEVDDD